MLCRQKAGDGMAGLRCGSVRSCALYGIQGIMVDIEVTILPGLPSFEIVGLGDSAVRESRNRVHAAIKNSGFDFPASRITASYAPAWQRKEGSAFDLPLALAILIASGQLPAADSSICVFGELSLSGEVRGVPGAICRVASCLDPATRRIMVPSANFVEADSAGKGKIWPVTSLRAAAGMLKGEIDFSLARKQARSAAKIPEHPHQTDQIRDICTIIGQEKAVRAVQISAAGRHNIMLLGSPGCGKTTLASILPDLLPPLDTAEALQVTRIFSASGLLGEGGGLLTRRPFRAPHHSASKTALIGGGAVPAAGEISLAHHGVLFLDEMTEFMPDALDLLRQPLADRQIRLARLHHSITYPADFLLVGAANPCRCGEYYEPNDRCRCTGDNVRQHLGRLSGPLLDRIDLGVEMTRLNGDDLPRCVSRPDSRVARTDLMAEKIKACWQIQKERCTRHGHLFTNNGRYCGDDLARFFDIPQQSVSYAARSAEELFLSVRGYQRILRVARTIADLEQQSQVSCDHVAEAIQYRLRLPTRKE